jgi:hypothetical protein
MGHGVKVPHTLAPMELSVSSVFQSLQLRKEFMILWRAAESQNICIGAAVHC